MLVWLLSFYRACYVRERPAIRRIKYRKVVDILIGLQLTQKLARNMVRMPAKQDKAVLFLAREAVQYDAGLLSTAKRSVISSTRLSSTRF